MPVRLRPRAPPLIINTDMHIVIGNYGDATIALLQWLKESQTQSVIVLSVNTGWESQQWPERVKLGEDFARACGFIPVRLHIPHSFDQIAQDRGDFPSPKFSWCVSLLKASPMLAWLLENDPSNQATIVLAKHRIVKTNVANLHEFEKSESYDNRQIWYPLYQHAESEWRDLIQRAGFKVLGHRSLECRLCIHSHETELNQLTEQEQTDLIALENKLGKKWQCKNPDANDPYLQENFANSCGSEYACGD